MSLPNKPCCGWTELFDHGEVVGEGPEGTPNFRDFWVLISDCRSPLRVAFSAAGFYVGGKVYWNTPPVRTISAAMLSACWMKR